MDQEQCCMDNHVSQECLVLCRQDPNYADYSSDGDNRFPNDTPCEKHKSAINRCWEYRGIYNVFVMYLRATLYNMIFSVNLSNLQFVNRHDSSDDINDKINDKTNCRCSDLYANI